MATLTIEISNAENYVLSTVASKNGVTNEIYAQNLLKSFLRNQARGYYRKKFEALTEEEMYNIFGGFE